MIKKLCGWCNKSLGDPVDDGSSSETVSHGICRNCVEGLMAGSGTPMQTFIDSMEFPILVVDQNVAVVSSNKAAATLTGKTLEQTQGKLSGEVFDCVHHTKPGGCGQTTHCKTCTIRNSVEHTYRTGEALADVPAYLDLDNWGGGKRLAFRISTEKRDHLVMLKIEEISDP